MKVPYAVLRHLVKFKFVNNSLKHTGLQVAQSQNLSASPHLNQEYNQKTDWGKNKKTRKVKLSLFFDTMSDPQIEEVLAPLRASVKEQVRCLISVYRPIFI